MNGSLHILLKSPYKYYKSKVYYYTQGKGRKKTKLLRNEIQEIKEFPNLHSYNLKPKTEFWSISKAFSLNKFSRK